MSDETDTPPGITGLLARGVHEASEQAIDGQQRAVRNLLAGLPAANAGAHLGLGGELGTFKTRLGSGGRVTIPEAERAALGIGEGDIVQTIVVPVDDTGDSNE